MIGLDTNVLVRYLVQDDAGQSRLASKEIEKAAENEELIVISTIVLCELVWVLESVYGYQREEISCVLEQILQTAQFDILEKDAIWGACSDYRNGKGDFSDYYIGRRHKEVGAENTLTFDKSLKTSDFFRVLKA